MTRGVADANQRMLGGVVQVDALFLLAMLLCCTNQLFAQIVLLPNPWAHAMSASTYRFYASTKYRILLSVETAGAT